ncbi:MAG: hypothetical protein SFY81_03960 [Verrucomicrobiota bacterium]|nr:hypothetical protein [Verrucomicrobiota bacterium]
MRLLKFEGENFVFRFEKIDKQILFCLLRRYPACSAPLTPETMKEGEVIGPDLHLLEASLEEQRVGHRKQVEAILSDEGRFQEDELGYRFYLTEPQIDCLLQILNNISVGSWLQLGRPNPQMGKGSQITEKNIELAWAMDSARLFQSELLKALRQKQEFQ